MNGEVLMIEEATKTLLYILAFSIYMLITEHSYRHMKNKRLYIMLCIAVFVLLCGGIGIAIYIYHQVGREPIILLASLVIGIVLSVLYFVFLIARSWSSTDKRFFFLFLFFVGVILFLTVFMRIGTSLPPAVNMTVFNGYKGFLEGGDSYDWFDTLKNILMFAPVGFLFPLVNREKCRHISYAVIFGLVLSTTVETLQLILCLGTCDVDDIIGNTLGTLLGYVCSVIVMRLIKNSHYLTKI